MQLQVEHAAAREIRRRGGALYIWQEPVGRAWLRDEQSFERPDGIVFRRWQEEGAEVYVADGVSVRLVTVRKRRWPFRGVRVIADGKTWGRRGRVSGETGLSYGGAGPP